MRSWNPDRIRDNERNSGFTYEARQVEQRRVGRVGTRIVQSVVDARIHDSDTRSLAPQLTYDALRVRDVPHEKGRHRNRRDCDRGKPAHWSAQPEGAQIRPQNLRNLDGPVRILVVLENGRYHTREGQP